MNPPFEVVKYRGFNIIKDDLPGGPKQRLYKLFDGVKKILYIGDADGLGILAISIIGKFWDAEVVILTNKFSDLTDQAIKNGAKVLVEKYNGGYEDYKITRGLEEEEYKAHFAKIVTKFLDKEIWVPDIGILKVFKKCHVVKHGLTEVGVDNPHARLWDEVLKKGKPGDWVYDVGSNILNVSGGSVSNELKENYKMFMISRELASLLPPQITKSYYYVRYVMATHRLKHKQLFDKNILLAYPSKEASYINIGVIDNIMSIKTDFVPPSYNTTLINSRIVSYGEMKHALSEEVIDILKRRGWSLNDMASCGCLLISLELGSYVFIDSFYDKLYSLGFKQEVFGIPFRSKFYFSGKDLYPLAKVGGIDLDYNDCVYDGKNTYIMNPNILGFDIQEFISKIKITKPSCILTWSFSEPKKHPNLTFKTLSPSEYKWSDPIYEGIHKAIEPINVMLYNFKTHIKLDEIVKSMNDNLEDDVINANSLREEYSMYCRTQDILDLLTKDTNYNLTKVMPVFAEFLHKQLEHNHLVYGISKDRVIINLLDDLESTGLSLSITSYNKIKTLIQAFSLVKGDIKITYDSIFLLIGDQRVPFPINPKGSILDRARCLLKYKAILHDFTNVPRNVFDFYIDVIKVEGQATPFNNHAGRHDNIVYCSLFPEADKVFSSSGYFDASSPSFIFTKIVDKDLIVSIQKSKVFIAVCIPNRIDNRNTLSLLSLPNKTEHKVYSLAYLSFGNSVEKIEMMIIHFNGTHKFPSWVYG